MANPVGTAQQVTQVDAYVADQVKVWNEEVAQQHVHFWEFWKKNAATYRAARFVIEMADDLVLLVEQHIGEEFANGPDKKATVIAAVNTVFDLVVVTALPLWMKPFTTAVRLAVVDVAVSEMIDFFVGKYKQGQWAKPAEPPPQQ